jgi:predicted phage terminase large subunit-like protein
MNVLEYFHIKEGNKNPTRVLNILIDQCLKYDVRSPIIEAQAFQEALTYRFYELIRERGIRLGVTEFKTTTNKDVRLMRLDPIVNMGRLHIKENMKEIIEQLAGYPHMHDDHIDCLATALHYAPKIYNDSAPRGNVDRMKRGVYNSVKMINNTTYKRMGDAIIKKPYGKRIIR